MITLHSQSDQFIDFYCTENQLIQEQNEDATIFDQFGQQIQQFLFQSSKEKIVEIDSILIQSLEEYMCKKECPCDPKGLSVLS